MRFFQHYSIAALTLTSVVVLIAQQPQPTAWAVPRVVRVSSSFRPVNGLALLPVENVMLAIYADEVGGVALWQEVQNVTMDGEGRFSVLLGSTRNEGLPLELFATGEPRWVGVQFQRPGEVEQPRVLLASVPYALKAADADTLGGQPASAYLLAPSSAPSTAGAAGGGPNTDASIKPARLTPKITSGTANNIAKFVNSTDLGNSVMAESNGKIGIGTSIPAAALEIVTTGGGAQFTNTLASSFTFNTFSSPGNASYLYDFGNLFATSGRYVQNSTLVDAGNILSLSASNNIRFYTNGNNERVRLDSAGNIGIGTTTPGWKMDVSGDINLTGSILDNGSLLLHTLGTNNTAVGFLALAPPFSGTNNTAVGFAALREITSGSSNTAVGFQALREITSGYSNTATGHDALLNNSTGLQNTGIGYSALVSNTTGGSNVAVGLALDSNLSGYYNVGIGFLALDGNTSGTHNIGVGQGAGANLTTGDNNVIIGGSPGVAGMSNTIIIGDHGSNYRSTATFIHGIQGATVGNHDGVPVLIDSAGQLGTSNSSFRYKEDVKTMAGASSNLMRLRPVTYRYKQPYADGSKPLDYGLIAEEVAEVYPDLVVKNQDGQIQTVQYQKLTPMLLNEVQKQNKEIDNLHQIAEKQSQHAQQEDETIHSLETRLAVLEAMLSSKATAASSPQQPIARSHR